MVENKKISTKKINIVNYNKKWKKCGKGGYGEYYQISPKRGIKILYNEKKLSIEELVKKAEIELETIQIASKCGYVPKGYRLVFVKFPNTVFIGIVLQHIPGIPYWKIKDNFKNEFNEKFGKDAEQFLLDKMIGVGVKHFDLHENNILAIVKKKKIKKVYAIDFSPDQNAF